MAKVSFWALARKMRSSDANVADLLAAVATDDVAPNLKTWGKLRTYLYSVGATDTAFIGARAVWRQYQKALNELTPVGKRRRYKLKRRYGSDERTELVRTDNQKLNAANVHTAARLKAAHLLSVGVSRAEIARRINVSYMTVWRWDRQIKTRGSESLLLKPHNGRPSKLSTADKLRLLKSLNAGALASGYPTERWTLARVVEQIAKISGKQYSLSGAERVLKGLNFSWRQFSN
jgi:transposase